MMEKTEMMKRYEKETGNKSMVMVKNGTLVLPKMTLKASQQFFPSDEYIAWLENIVDEDKQRMTPAQEHAFDKESL